MEHRKRPRSISLSSNDSESSIALGSTSPSSPKPLQPDSAPAAKYHRAPSPVREFLCTLPPTCSQPGTSRSFANAEELDAHQTSYHQWVCRVPIRDKPGRVGQGDTVIHVPEHFAGRSGAGARTGQRWRECGKVFPDERLLDLHYTETHDSMSRERQERGEKIFACFLPPEQCGQMFLTPKKRRIHLIETHHYPAQYFFSITNHGLNQILRTDGPAASLLRPRKDPPPSVPTGTSDGVPGDLTHLSTTSRHSTGLHGRKAHSMVAHFPDTHHAPSRPPPDNDVDMDDLAAKMAGLESSLSFVPRVVGRRGRGGMTRNAFGITS